MLDVTPTGSFRLGWRALTLDALCALGAMALAYQLRFVPGDAPSYLSAAWPALLLIVSLQLLLAVGVGLYRATGQVMWPVRLGVASIAGAAVGVGLVAGAGWGEGVSRQAVGTQAALLWLTAVVWRALAGLRFRQERDREIKAQFGGAELVPQGEEFSSMVGGVVRAWRYSHLLRNLVVKDLKMKYRGSVLGFAWSLLNPVMMIGVYAVAFTYVMRVQTPRFVLFILVGLLSWNFFAGAVASATDAIAANGSLLRSVVFPRVVLPFAGVLFNLTQYLLNILVFLPIMLLVYRVPAEPRMLLFPVFLLLQVMFITGIALVLSTATVMFRDVKHLVEVGLGIGFWATPIIYEASMVPKEFQSLLLLSPMASYIRAYQDIFYYGVMPDMAIWTVAITYACGALVCGLSVFLAYEDRFSEFV